MPKVALRGLKGRLVRSSIDAYILALENVNRLSGGYRFESFTFLIVNAWELLLKARIVHLRGNAAIFVKEIDSDSGKKVVRTLRIEKCLNILFTDKQHPTRRNLEEVIVDRNKSTHLVISRITNEQLAVFQSCVVNYHRLLIEWFGVSVADRVSVAMMTIVFDADARKFDLTDSVLKRTIGKEGVAYLARRQAEIRELQAKTDYSIEFAAQIQYKIAVVGKSGQADITFDGGTGGVQVGLLDKPRDANETHPLRRKDVIDEVRRQLPQSQRFNEYDFDSIRRMHKVDSRNDFFFCSATKGSYPQYSREFARWIVDQVKKDSEFLARCREHRKSEKLQKAKRVPLESPNPIQSI